MRWVLVFFLLLLPWVGQARVNVEVVDGEPVVKIAAQEVVAWPLSQKQVVVLAFGRGDVDLAAGVKGEVLEMMGMHGVILEHSREGIEGWNVMQDGENWLLRRGKANGEALSAILLRDGWWFEGESVAPRRIKVRGEEWQVAGVRRNVRVHDALLGAARRIQGKRALQTAEARVPEVGDALAKMDQAKKSKLVPVFTAEAIEPMAGPVVVSETLDFDIYGVYVPGVVVSLTVPDEFLRKAVTGDAGRPVIDEADVIMGDRLLPLTEGKYFDELVSVQNMIAEVPEGGADERDVRSKLAAFYLAWQRPEEARGVLALLPKRGDGLPADPLARLYEGMAVLAMGGVPTVDTFDQRGGFAAHAKLWRAVRLGAREDYAELLAEWPAKTDVLADYPAYLRQLAQLAYARALVMVGNKKEAREVVDGLAARFGGEGLEHVPVPTEVLKLQGLVRLGTDEEGAGLEYLAKATESVQDLAQAAQARYAFIMALHQRKDLADAQLRSYLEELSLDWRGDALERNVLGTLADLYDRAGEPREALERWRLLVRLFSDSRGVGGRGVDMNSVTERMSGALLNVFNPENPRTYDILTMLGLYYDFRELVPNDARGDRVNEQVARMLTDRTLWLRAMPLLEQQLEYRPLEEDSRGRQVLLLAEVLRRQGRAADALKLLDKWKPVANTQMTSRNWTISEAKALMDLRRFESVRRALADLVLNDREAAEMSLEAAWELGLWSDVIEGLQRDIKEVTSAQLEADRSLQLKVFRLGYALGQQKDAKGLGDLRARYASVFERLPQLADGLNAVAAATGVVVTGGGGSLAPLSKAMADLSSLGDRVANTRAQMARAEAAQAEYDAKMRYMELLPPPSL